MKEKVKRDDSEQQIQNDVVTERILTENSYMYYIKIFRSCLTGNIVKWRYSVYWFLYTTAHCLNITHQPVTYLKQFRLTDLFCFKHEGLDKTI